MINLKVEDCKNTTVLNEKHLLDIITLINLLNIDIQYCMVKRINLVNYLYKGK